MFGLKKMTGMLGSISLILFQFVTGLVKSFYKQKSASTLSFHMKCSD